MIGVNTILSMDQGKLFAKPQSDAEYFARFQDKPKAEPQTRRPWFRLNLTWLLRPVLHH